MSPALVRCREQLPEYDVERPPAYRHLSGGVTAVLRVRDEARSLPWALPPLLRSVDAVVLVDNLSADGSADIARKVAAETGLAHRLDVTAYPFEVSRCGPEHLATPPDSVHSLTHYYNWSFSQARTRHVLKWDGDMVLTPEGEAVLSELSWQLDAVRAVVHVRHLPLYIESAQVAHLDLGVRPQEPWIYPHEPGSVYAKAFDFEVRTHPSDAEQLTLPRGVCFELKWLDDDEFDHWTSPEAFHPARTPRKLREHRVFTALRDGDHASLEDVLRVEAPAGVHVVDHVAQGLTAVVSQKR